MGPPGRGGSSRRNCLALSANTRIGSFQSSDRLISLLGREAGPLGIDQDPVALGQTDRQPADAS